MPAHPLAVAFSRTPRRSARSADATSLAERLVSGGWAQHPPALIGIGSANDNRLRQRGTVTDHGRENLVPRLPCVSA